MAERKKTRIPGMAWTVVAFIPWILYWVLAGTGRTTAAVLSGLAVSLAINGYRFAVRKVKILDSVSLLFLAISAFVTLVLRSDLLAFYGGMLADATLALMAWGSLLAGNPFTYDYAKEDWDKAFWNDPIFIETNQIITAVWGGIFTVQALMGGLALAMELEGSARIVLVAALPRLLLVVGVAFSAWFPTWYPQRAAARRSRQVASRASGIGKPGGIGMPGDIAGLQLIKSMPLTFNAKAAGNLQASIQFRLGGDGGGTGYLDIAAGRCTFHPGEAEQPALVIESPADVWTAISRGEKNGTEAFLSGAYRATGDMSLLMQLETLFGAHSPESGKH
jgi:putative sterol carrier protein